MSKKSEIRNPKSETNSNDQSSNVQNGLPPGDSVSVIGILDLGFVSNFGFRISDFQGGTNSLFLLLGCLFLLAGCKVGPNFKPPETPMPKDWVGPLPPGPTATEQDLARWWTVFNDPILTALIERAVETNLDLKLAEARVRQARATRGIAVGGLGPTVTGVSSYTRSRNVLGEADLYQAGFDAAWEVDIFGGVRRGIEAATANLEAAIDARVNVFVTLTAEVATNYINLRGFQEQIAIAQRNLTAQRHSLDLTRQRFQGGLVSGLDVANAEAQVASTAAQIPVLEQSAQQAIYGLGVLLGLEPGALVNELGPARAIPTAPPAVPVGVPSELLRRRPDILQAEASIHAATAEIGVATADLFPRFSITGSLGTQGNRFSSLGDWNNRFWSIGPSANWTVFATGAIRANIEVQKALQEQSLLTYRQIVLTAIQDVENALIASTKEHEHYQALTDAVVADRRAVDLATKLYTQGQTDFLNVLQAQGSLYLSETAQSISARTVSNNLVALYKAIGGGWTPPPLPPDPPTKG